jgi:hypothetical protein
MTARTWTAMFVSRSISVVEIVVSLSSALAWGWCIMIRLLFATASSRPSNPA